MAGGRVNSFVVAKRREFRGSDGTAAAALAAYPGVRIKGAHNPDLVVIETTDETAECLRHDLGEMFWVEPRIEHSTM